MDKHIIYISNNDGSDTRIVKEINTLSTKFQINFIGIQKRNSRPLIKNNVHTLNLINGNIKNPFTLIMLYITIISVTSKSKTASIHVVNEQLLFILLPIIYGRRIILDSFDSMFLRLNKGGENWSCLKRILYGAADAVIVTDKNRLQLLPELSRQKAIIIPNVPVRARFPRKRSDPASLTLCYFGTLAKRRGSSFISGLLEADSAARVIAAGWITDAYSRDLLRHPRIEFLGSCSQHEVNTVLAERGDYLIAIYPTDNTNNRFASPNKIYDALHTRTPLIISDGIVAAKDVLDMGIGIALDTDQPVNYAELASFLRERRGEFHFDDRNIVAWSWENYEHLLLLAHE